MASAKKGLTMSKTIIYKDMTNSDAECCRELCNELMQHQASKGVKYPEILTWMNFDNRLKANFDSAQNKKLIVAYDEEKPIGYVYCEIFPVVEENKYNMKPFVDKMSKEDADALSLLPMWLECPTVIGEIGNLYVKKEYRGLNIGKELVEQGLRWLKADEDVSHLFVFVSNGNNPAPFYRKFGFEYSHDFANGFIKVYAMEK